MPIDPFTDTFVAEEGKKCRRGAKLVLVGLNDNLHDGCVGFCFHRGADSVSQSRTLREFDPTSTLLNR